MACEGKQIWARSIGGAFLIAACLYLVWVIAGDEDRNLLHSARTFKRAPFLESLYNATLAGSRGKNSLPAGASSSPAGNACGCSEALVSGPALQGLSVGQKRCIAVNLSGKSGLEQPRPQNHDLQQWEQEGQTLSVLVVVRGPNSARALKLERKSDKCFTGDVIVPRGGEYAVEVLARLEGGPGELGLKNQAMLLVYPVLVTARSPAEGEESDETYDPAPRLCPSLSDVTTVDQLADGRGFWIPCSDAPYLQNCSNILTDGWTYVQPDCHFPLYEQDALVEDLERFAESAAAWPGTESKKLAILVLGDSRTRGLFLEVASKVLSSEAAANLTRSEYGKVWGIIHFETPTLSMTWRDLRGYSTPCPSKVEAYLWPDGVTLGFERIKRCLARQAEVRNDLARLVGRVKPDLVYAQNGFMLLDEILSAAPWVVRTELLGWVQMSETLGMVSDNVNWAVSTNHWRRFNTLEVELPLYQELCNEHQTSVYDIHMHAFCGTQGERLCGIVNQMTSQILLHDVIERLPQISELRRANKDASWGPTEATGNPGLEKWLEVVALQPGQYEPGSERNERDRLYACQAGADHFEVEYTLGLLDKLVCKESMVRVTEVKPGKTQLRCSNYSILDQMATQRPHRWIWQL